MDPATLVPVPDSIPVYWGWFQFLLILTFMLHILFMNVMLGTGIIALVDNLKKPDAPSPLSQDISHSITYAIAFTVNMGVAPLLFLQVLYGQFMYTSSVLMAVYWLAVIGLVILSYYSAYLYNFRFEKLGAGRFRFIGLTVLLLLCVGFIFTNNMTLMLTPQHWVKYFDSPNGTLLNFQEPSLFPRYLHFMVASIGVGGLYVAILNSIRFKKGQTEAAQLITRGMRWFTFGTVAAAGIGIVFLFALPEGVRGLFLGGDFWHTALFLLSQVGVGAAIVFGLKERVWSATAALLATVFLMILVRDLVRQAYLAPYFKPADLVVVPQYSPMIVFLVSLVLGLLVVAYMLKLAAQSGKEVQ